LLHDDDDYDEKDMICPLVLSMAIATLIQEHNLVYFISLHLETHLFPHDGATLVRSQLC
jgi:hypothetical protein